MVVVDNQGGRSQEDSVILCGYTGKNEIILLHFQT
jgi:hypothetical protein